MKVLSIGMDRKLFEEKSDVLSRSLGYSSKMEELHIIVFSLKKHHLKHKQINNLYIYPTNSSSRVSFLFDAYNLGKKIIKNGGMSRNNSVITAQDPMTIIGYFFSREFKIPLQLQLHTDISSPYFKKSLTTWINFWYSGLVHVPLTKFLIPRVQGIRVVSESIKESIVTSFSNLKGPLDVLPVFIDINEISSSYPGKDIKKDFPQFSKVVLMASRLTKEKRIDIALLSLKKVISKTSHVGLVICGEGSEKNNLQWMVKELGLQDNVVFLPWQNDLVSYYKTADAFLLTSQYEGYGLTLVEAGASGCPIVTTMVGIAKTDLFKNAKNSYVCPIGDTECISGGIIELVSDLSKRESFKREIQESIKKIAITREEYIKQYVGLLEKLIKNV